MSTTELLNGLIDRAGTDGLPDLNDVLAASVTVDDAVRLPLTVAETADLIDVSAHTLRYYERIGLVDVPRSASGQRRYDKRALARVVFLTRLRLSGMSIADITSYIQLVEEGDGTVDARLALLHAHRAKVRRQRDELDFALSVIDYKITTYGGRCSD